MHSTSLGRDVIVALAVAAGVFLLELPIRLCAVNLMDEGAILQIAADMVSGKRLYTDAAHYAFPGVFWLTAAAFRVWGTSIETARTLALVLFAGTAAVVYLIARWWHGRLGALGVVVVFLAYRVWAYPHWQMLSYSTLAVALVLLATWLVGEGLARGSALWLTAAGVAGALAVASKQDSGFAGAAALATAVLLVPPPRLGRRRAVVAFAAGGLGTIVVVVAAIVRSGIGADLVREAILAPLYGLAHFEYLGRPALRPLLQQDANIRQHVYAYFPSIVFDLHWPAVSASALYRQTALVDAALKVAYHLPWMIAAAGALVVAARRLNGPLDLQGRRLVVLLLVSAAFVAAFNRPQDWVHLLVLYPPTLLLADALAVVLVGGLRPARALGWLLVAAVAVPSALLAVEFARDQSTPIPNPRGVLYGPPEKARELRALLDALGAAPAAPLGALPYQPLLNFLADRPGLSRYYLVWPVDRAAGRDDDIIRRLEGSPQALVVYSPTQVPHFPRLRSYAGRLFRYLVKHFDIAQTFGGDVHGYTFVLLERAAREPGRSLLGAALESALVLEEPHDGPARVALPAERRMLVGEELWPFARVLRVATLPDASVAVVYRVTPAPGERLRASYGLNPDHWEDLVPPECRFAVAVRGPGDGEERELVAATVDPLHEAEDRRWIPIDVDLSPWAGRAIELVLRTSGPPGAPMQPDRAGWANPRLVSALSVAPQPHGPHGPQRTQRVAETVLRQTVAPLDEDDRHLSQAKAAAEGAILELDQEGVAAELQAVHVDRLQHLAPEALKAARAVPDR